MPQPAAAPPATSQSTVARPRSRILWWPPVLVGVVVLTVGGMWLVNPRSESSSAVVPAIAKRGAPAVPRLDADPADRPNVPPNGVAIALPDPAVAPSEEIDGAGEVAKTPQLPINTLPAANRTTSVAPRPPTTPASAPLESPTLFAWEDVSLAVIDPGRFAVGLRLGPTGKWLVLARATDQLADGAIELLVRRSIPRIAADPALARQMYLNSTAGQPLADAQLHALARYLQTPKFLPPLLRDEPRCVVYRDVANRRQTLGLLTAIDAESLSLVTAAGKVDRILKSQIAPGTARLAEPAEIAGSLTESSFWDDVALNVALALESRDDRPKFLQVAVLSQLELRPGAQSRDPDRTARARQQAWKLLTRQLGAAARLSPGASLTSDLDKAVTERLQALSIPVCEAAQLSRLMPQRPEQFMVIPLTRTLHATHALSLTIDAEAAVPSVAVKLVEVESGRELWQSNSLRYATEPSAMRQHHAVRGSIALIELADADVEIDPAAFWEPEHVLAPANWQRRRDHLVRIDASETPETLPVSPLFGLQTQSIPAANVKRRRDVHALDDVPADLQLRYVLDQILTIALPPAARIQTEISGNPVVSLGSRDGVRPGDRLRILHPMPAGEEWLAGELRVSEVRESECVVEPPRTGLEAWWPDLPALVPDAYAVVQRPAATALGIVSPYYVIPVEKYPVVRKISQLKDRDLQQECLKQADQQTMQDAARLAGKLTRACEQLEVPIVTFEGQQVIGARTNVDANAETLFNDCVERGATHVLGGYLWPYDAVVSAKGVQMLKYRCKLAIRLSSEAANSEGDRNALELSLDLNRSHLGDVAQ